MNAEEINQAIAEACGWTKINSYEEYWKVLDKKSEKRWWAQQDLPDYCNDLDAMHSAEETLTQDQRSDYVSILADLIGDRFNHDGALEDWESYFKLLHAKAERPVALLKAIGKWQE